MTEVVEALMDALSKFDQEIKTISESDVSRAIQSVKDQSLSEPPMQLIAEAMAFDFWENYRNQETGWGTYYGPMFVFSNADGTATEWPSIKKVTEQIINYWTDRAKAANHPVLCARYADLVWDFQKVVTSGSPHYAMAQIVIDSTIEIAQKNCHSRPVDVIRKLERALSIAISLNDCDRVQKVAEATMAYEDAVTDDSKPGLWGFAYDLLFDNDKVKLPEPLRQKLLDDLEGHLQRVSNSSDDKGIDPWLVEAAALRLAKHYRKIGNKEDTKRVVMAVRDAFVEASSKASGLQASGWLQRVHATLKEYGFSDEADKLTVQLREIGEKARSELGVVSHTMEISKEKMEEYIAALIEGELDVVLTRIAAQYIPKKSEIEKQLEELAGEAPIAFLIPMELQDKMGRPLAKVGSLEEDLEGHTVKHLSQNMAFESMFLRQVLDSLRKKYPAFENLFLDYLFRSPIFVDDRKSIIGQGVKDYLNGNHVAAVHLLIPQIENSLRVLVETAGGSVLKPARAGGFNLKILDDLLRDPLVVQVFGEDIVFYFRALLVDPRGWNLRNRVSHGLCDVSEFEPSISDRLIHVLLCLALVRKKEQAKK